MFGQGISKTPILAETRVDSAIKFCCTLRTVIAQTDKKQNYLELMLTVRIYLIFNISLLSASILVSPALFFALPCAHNLPLSVRLCESGFYALGIES